MSQNRLLPPGWRIVRFGDVVRNVKVDVDPEMSGLERYIAGEHMDTDDLHIRRWGTVGDGYLGPAFHRKFVAGQVLYGSRRTYLRKVAVADFDGICANTTFVLEPANDELLPELLPFVMQTEAFNKHSVEQSRGSVNPYVNWKDIAWYEFALPPLDEQRRIAEVLWVADEAKEAYRNTLDLMGIAVRAIFDGLIKQGGYTETHELKDAIDGIVAGRSPACSSEPAADDQYGVLKVSAVSEDAYVESENKALLRQSDFIPEYEVQPGYLLVTRANALKSGVGRVCIVENTRPGLMLSDKTLRLLVNEKKARPRFLVEALRSKSCRQYIESVLNGTDAKNISQDKLRRAPICLPPLGIQIPIEETLSQYDAATKSMNSHLWRLLTLQRQLIQTLVEGQEAVHVQ